MVRLPFGYLQNSTRDVHAANALLGMEGISLSAEAAGGRTALEVAAKSWRQKGAEDEISTPESRQGQPEQEDKFEGEVEWEPVDDVDKALNHSEEGEDHPVGQPLGIIGLGRGEKGLQRIVPRNDEASDIGEKLTSQVENDKEEVQRGKADNRIGFGNRSLLLKVIERRIFGELSVELSHVVLDAILGRRHCCNSRMLDDDARVRYVADESG